MKRNDDVFFFTLIDFLLQVLFFGLLFFVIVTHQQDAPPGIGKSDKIDHLKVKTVADWTGFVSIPDLADFLKPLPTANKNEFKIWAPFISTHHYDDVRLKLDWVDSHGGIPALDSTFAKAFGKPSCLSDDQKNNRATRIAQFLLTDNQIEILSVKPQFQSLLLEMNLSLDAVKTLSLSEFRNKFMPLNTMAKYTNCRFFVLIKEQTEYHKPRDAVNSVFRTN